MLGFDSFGGNPQRAACSRLWVVGGVLGLASSSWSAAVPHRGASKDFLKWLDREVFKRVQISGSRSFGYHQHEVEGDRQAFETLTYSGQGGKRFTDIGAVSIAGQNVAGLFNFRSTVVNNRFVDPQEEKSSLDYDRMPLTVNVGDIHGTLLNTNRFASFSKYLQGAMARYQHGRFTIKGVTSESKGSAKAISIAGNNSAGPYYLQHSQIVRGSEEVQVDGQPMRLGQDYVINYEIGAISFVGRVIAPTSSIVVSFEVLGFNSGLGRVTGVGAEYNFGRAGRIGVTQLSQRTGSGDALSSRLELFQGSGAPSTPYFLQFEPLLSRPIIVKLDGIPQILGVDYRFDEVNPVIFYFLRFVPFTSTIEVAYTPTPTSTVNGDRDVLGFDYRLPLGKGGNRGYLGYYQATGEQKSLVSPLKGTARGMDGAYRLGNWELRGGIRNVPNGYVSIETRGLSRNEEATDWGARYTGKQFELDMRNTNSVIGIRQTDAKGDVFFRKARAANFRAEAKYRPEIGVTWDLEHNRSGSRNSGNQTELNRTRLSTGRTFGRLILNAGYEDQQGRGPVASGTGSTNQDVSLKSLFLDGTYTAGDAWSFRGKVGLNDVKTSEDSGTGQDHLLSVTYTPRSHFSVSGTYGVSDSGALATLGGFDTGFGLGYGGNGFSGGVSGPGFAAAGANSRYFQINARYAFGERLNLIASAYQSRSTGSISSNSETEGLTLGSDWDLGKGHFLGVSINHSSTEFVGSASQVDTTNLNFDMMGRLGPRLSYSFGLSLFETGGNNPFGQNSTAWDGSLSYRLAERQSLSISGTMGRTSGYLGQNEDHVALSYSYQIYRNIALVGSYRVRDVRNRLATETAGAYRSRGFDLILTTNFVP